MTTGNGSLVAPSSCPYLLAYIVGIEGRKGRWLIRGQRTAGGESGMGVTLGGADMERPPSADERGRAVKTWLWRERPRSRVVRAAGAERGNRMRVFARGDGAMLH